MARAVDVAYNVIREGILSGNYPQGSHITAQHLAEVSQLSRTPVREAMRRLHAEGLIEVIPNRGAFVSRWTESEIEQLYELRVVLESFAAQEAAKRATPDDIATLTDLAKQMRALSAKQPVDYDAITTINDQFHKAVLAAAGNLRLTDMLNAIVDVPLVLNTFRRYTLEEIQRSAAQHMELVVAFTSRDTAWAGSVMTSHIRSARHTLTRDLGQGDNEDEAVVGDGTAKGTVSAAEPAKKRRVVRRPSTAKKRDAAVS